jgi:antitoxin component YwqK of YwqJK toxin-antitoxin module
MHPKYLLLLTLLPLGLLAQKKEESFDYNFKPTEKFPRYYVFTEPKNGKWYRQAYYIPEKTLAMMGWYQDEACKIADSTISWYHPNKNLKSTGVCRNGKKEGIWREFHENGMERDSGFFNNGHRQGISLGWDDQGYLVDSSYFDGNGNGTLVRWYANGPVYSAGRVINDTSKIKRWVYHHKNGQTLAIEDYDNGKRINCSCFTETGQKLDACEEEEAYFPGKEKGWISFLTKNLDAMVPIRNNVGAGYYTALVKFIVNTDGSISDITPVTSLGFGMEQEVVRIMKKSPRWIPAVQFGRKVKAYRIQPVTFGVTND